MNAVCQNYPGNYTCACQDGYTGNAFDGVSESVYEIIPTSIADHDDILFSFLSRNNLGLSRGKSLFIFSLFIFFICIF